MLLDTLSESGFSLQKLVTQTMKHETMFAAGNLTITGFF